MLANDRQEVDAINTEASHSLIDDIEILILLAFVCVCAVQLSHADVFKTTTTNKQRTNNLTIHTDTRAPHKDYKEARAIRQN